MRTHSSPSSTFSTLIILQLPLVCNKTIANCIRRLGGNPGVDTTFSAVEGEGLLFSGDLLFGRVSYRINIMVRKAQDNKIQGTGWWLARRISGMAGLFLLALVPRLVGLGVTVTTDEPSWVKRSAGFALALLNGDWLNTFQSNHPGVTTMWSGAIGLMVKGLLQGAGLAAFLEDVLVNPFQASLFPAARLLTTVLTAACVVAVYLLVKKLFDPEMALLAAFLLAFDPFYLAHSRVIHHDALGTTFMTVSLLGLAVYLWRGQGRFYLILSGVSAGLAALSKISSLFLGPFVGLLFLGAWGGRRAEGIVPQAIRPLALWGGVLLATFVLVWPAMWVGPLRTLEGTLGASAELAEAGHLQFFRGRIALDAGPWFYPVVFLFRTTPLSLLGLVLVAPALALIEEGERGKERLCIVGALLAYVGLFIFYLSLSAKKQDRYLLPIFPVIDILAALGLWGVFRFVGAWHFQSARHLTRLKPVAILAGGLILQAAFILPYYPYYLAYYNPLAGGPQAALRTLRVGWGDGLDQAGRYLSQKENASHLTVAAVPAQCLAPFFPGKALNLYTHPPALSADYVILYINQVQRQAPSPALVEFFRAREAEHVVRVDGLDYAWIYPGVRYLSREPQPVQHNVGRAFASTANGGRVGLVGYDLEGSPVEAGSGVKVALHWECLAKMEEDYSVSLRLVDEEGHVWGQHDGQPAMNLLPTSQWEAGDFIKDEHPLEVENVTPPGEYGLEVGLYSPQSGEVLDAAPGTRVTLGTVSVTRPARFPAPDEVTMAHNLGAMGVDLSREVRLLGYDRGPEKVHPGQSWPVALYWQALADVQGDYGVRLYLKSEDGRAWNEVIARPACPTDRWEKGQIIRDWHDLPIAADTPGGEYEVWLALLSSNDLSRYYQVGEVSLGSLVVEGRARLFEVPPIEHPLEARLGHVVECLGYDLETTNKQGVTLRLTLYWRALAEMETSYTVFVHLLDGEGRVRSQRDSIPGQGMLTTTGWLAGEVIIDDYELDVPAGEYDGEYDGGYDIEIGMYQADTGERLPVYQASGRAADDRILLGKVKR